MEAPDDSWLISDHSVIRIHKIPRYDLYRPDEATFPVPVHYVDVLRRTETDLPDESEAKIDDFWTDAGTRSLSDPWTGRTIFTLRKPPPPKGYSYVDGEAIQDKANSTRPAHVHPKVWIQMNAGDRKRAREFWAVESVKRETARKNIGISLHIPENEVVD